MPTAWLAKVRLVGEMLTAGAVPVPERLTLWGLPVALSEMLSEAVRLPLAEGVKVTLMVQLALLPPPNCRRCWSEQSCWHWCR